MVGLGISSPVRPGTGRVGNEAVKRALQRAVKTAAAAADRLRPARPGVVVLLYHRVGGATGTDVDLPVGLFIEQIAALSERARVVTLDDALALLSTERADEQARPAVVVTFDDG